MKSWAKNHDSGGTVLNLYIQPGAASNMLVGCHGDRLKLKIKAPPREGEANEGVIEFLSGLLKISKSRVHLLRGESSRQKDVLVELPLDEVIILLQVPVK